MLITLTFATPFTHKFRTLAIGSMTSLTTYSVKRTWHSLLNLAQIGWALLRGASLPTIQSRLYSLVYASSAVRNLRFFNYGYAPVAPDLCLADELFDEPFQASLYHHVLVAAQQQLGHVPRNIVEVACSRGGGLLYAAKLFPNVQPLIGIDLQPDAVAAAHAFYAADKRLHFVAASGHSLPLQAQSVDLLVCVEALMNLNRPRFLQESVRVLLPQGVLATTGSQLGNFDRARSELVTQAQHCGLAVVQMTDITANILAACQHDAPRRQKLIARAPWFTRHYLRDFLGIPGAKKFQAYQSGERCYYMAVLQRR
jgi:ubiquinone/menaquinone biosynthesis C-methylase UbiE